MDLSKYTAIITDVRYRMSLAVIRDLSELGVRIIAVECDKSTPPLGFYSKYAAESVFLNQESYGRELYSLCEKVFKSEGSKPALMPIGVRTLNLLAENELGFENVCGFIVPDPDKLALLNDKSGLSELAKKLEIPVPKIYLPPYEDIAFPCVVKPACGEKFGLQASERYRITDDSAGLNDAIAYFDKLCPGDRIIVQQYLQGDGYGCSVLAKDGRIISSICHKRIREYPVSGGPSACCQCADSAEIMEYTSRIVENLNLSGIVMFEFKADDGKFYLLESNPRVWGSYPLTRISGNSMSKNWFFESLDLDDLLIDSAYNDASMHFIISDIAAGFSYLKQGQLKRGFSAFFSCFDPKVRDGLLEFNDIKPALMYLGGMLKRK